MALNLRRFTSGVQLLPTTLTIDTAGELQVNSANSNKLTYNNGTSNSPVVTESHTATLTNKTIDGNNNTLLNIPTSSFSGIVAPANGGTGIANSSTLTLGANNTTLTTTGATSVTLPTTGTLATLAGTETLTNKTISGSNNTITNISLTTGVTGVLPETSGGTNQSSYTTGDILYSSATNTLSKLPIGAAGQGLSVVNGIPSWQTVQAGAKNYITFNNFENNSTTGWSLGTVGTLTNGIPTGSPTFGSGASGNLSIATISSGQLAGTYSLSYVSSAATTAGNMLATQAYTLDKEDQAKVMTFKFYYQLASFSGTQPNFSGTSSNSFGVAAYDVTNSSWMSLAGNFSMTQSVGVGLATGTFQTNATTASIRFVIYNINATNNATTLYFDDFYVGPQTAPIGAVVTDWQTYTPTLTGMGTPTNVNFWSRRVGDSLEVQGYATSGSTTGTQLQMTLGFAGGNGNVTIASAISASADVGYGVNSAATAQSFVILGLAGNNYLQVSQPASAFSSLSPQLANAVINNAQTISFFARVPIVGWSSQVQMSSDTDTRVIAAQYNTNAGTSITAAVTDIPFTALTYDTSGSWNGSQFVTPVSGYYTIAGSWRSSTSISQNTNVYVNGVFGIRVNIDIANTQVHQLIPGQVKLNAGDLLSIRSDATVTLQSSPDSHWIAINRISGPAVIAATETVAAKYQSSQTTLNPTIINYDTKVYDTHNAVTVGASWIFTAPISGIYDLYATLQLSPNAGSFVANDVIQISSRQNGSTVQNSFIRMETTVTSSKQIWIDDSLLLNAGDTVNILNTSNTTAANQNISGGILVNYITISRRK